MTIHKPRMNKKSATVVIGIVLLACIGVVLYNTMFSSDVTVSSEVAYMDKAIIEKAKQEKKLGSKNWIGGTAPVHFESFISKGLSIYAVNNSGSDGAFTCKLLDIASWQIYGTYIAWGSEGKPGHEYTYYQNAKINKRDTILFLDEHCKVPY